MRSIASSPLTADTVVVAEERREDVGLMKALGGSIFRIMVLFFSEVGVLGAVGGFIGCLIGLLLSIWMGERVFGASITPRWQIFPPTPDVIFTPVYAEHQAGVPNSQN